MSGVTRLMDVLRDHAGVETTARTQENTQPLVRYFTHARRTHKDGFTSAGTSRHVQHRSCRVVTAS